MIKPRKKDQIAAMNPGDSFTVKTQREAWIYAQIARIYGWTLRQRSNHPAGRPRKYGPHLQRSYKLTLLA